MSFLVTFCATLAGTDSCLLLGAVLMSLILDCGGFELIIVVEPDLRCYKESLDYLPYSLDKSRPWLDPAVDSFDCDCLTEPYLLLTICFWVAGTLVAGALTLLVDYIVLSWSGLA